jgi:hypothetical protein
MSKLNSLSNISLAGAAGVYLGIAIGSDHKWVGFVIAALLLLLGLFAKAAAGSRS